MRRKPLPSILEDAIKKGLNPRNNLDVIIYYFTKRNKKLTPKVGSVVTLGGRNIGKVAAIDRAKK